MKTIKIKTATITAAAERANTTPEGFVAIVCSISAGRRVFAHFIRYDGEYSIFQV